MCSCYNVDMNRWGRLVVAVVFVLPFLLLILGSVLPVGAQQSGDIDVSAVVPGAAPTTAPTIGRPANNATFSEKNIEVTGGCTSGLIVKVFSNGIFVGSTVCQGDNTYSLRVDLFVDRNELVARQYDLLNQPGPNSEVVVVFYLPQQPLPDLPGETPMPESPNADNGNGNGGAGDTPGTSPRADQTPDTVAEFQLVIDYDYTSQAAFVGQPFSLPIHFIGGTPPYTITIDWGDGSVNHFVRHSTEDFLAEYTYTRPGLITITITITDSTGQVSRLQFVTLIHGNLDKVVNDSFLGTGVIPQNLTPTAVAMALGITFAIGIAVGVFFPVIARLAKRAIIRFISYIIRLIKRT